MISDLENAKIDEYVVLDKFEGEPVEENLVERIHLENGEITKKEVYEDGVLVASENYYSEGGDTSASN